MVIGDVQDGSRVAKETGAIYRPADVRDSESVRALADFAVSEFGRLDVLSTTRASSSTRRSLAWTTRRTEPSST